MAEIEAIWMFHTGRVGVRRGLLEAGAGAEQCYMPVLCFLVVHPQELVLVDAGFGERAVNLGASWWGRLLGGLFKVPIGPGMDCRSQICACGVDPGTLRRGVLTHLHWDHVGGVVDLPEVRFSVARRELDTVRGTRGARALRRGYPPGLSEVLDRFEAVDFGAAEDLAPFDADHDLLGDGSIRLLPTPGHAPGHTSVLLRAKGGRDVLLVGDAAFTQGQILGSTELGLMPRSFAADLPAARDTLHRLRVFVERRPGLRVFTSHDPDQGDDVTDGPVNILED